LRERERERQRQREIDLFNKRKLRQKRTPPPSLLPLTPLYLSLTPNLSLSLSRVTASSLLLKIDEANGIKPFHQNPGL